MKWQVCLISFLLSLNIFSINNKSILFVLSSLQPQVNWLSTFRLIYEKVSTKIDVIYMLRLSAGKFGPICIEFSPATFFGKNLNNASWKNARQKKIKKHLMQIVNFSFTLKKKKNQNHLESSVSIFLRLNFLARDVWKFQTKENHG